VDLSAFEDIGSVLATAFCVLFFGSYAVALFGGRRRLMAAARWVQEFLQPLGGPAQVRWTASSAFHITATDQSQPFRRMVVTVLLKPRDLIAQLVVNRLLRRNDLLMVRCELLHQPIWGLEVYRPRTLLSGLAQKEIGVEQWSETTLTSSDHRIAHGGGKAEEMCEALLNELGAERAKLWRLAVRRQFPHLLLAVDLPEMTAQEAIRFRETLTRMVRAMQPYSTVVEARAEGEPQPDVAGLQDR
jgi:hypothetical protein